MNQSITPYIKIFTDIIIKDKNKNNITIYDVFNHIGKKVNFGLFATYFYFYSTHKKFCSYHYKDSFWIEERRICNNVGVNQSTVSIYVKILEDLELLKVIRRGSSKDARSNVYSLIEPTQANLKRSLEIAKAISSEIKSSGSLRNYLTSSSRKNKYNLKNIKNDTLNKPPNETYGNDLREKSYHVIKDAKIRIYKALGKKILF